MKKHKLIIEVTEEECGCFINPAWIVRPVSYEPMMNDEYDTPLINAVMEQVKDSVISGDVESLDEVLRYIPRNNLVQYAIPEEEWEKWLNDEELEDIYQGRTRQ